jgi:hypothetical protein
LPFTPTPATTLRGGIGVVLGTQLSASLWHSLYVGRVSFLFVAHHPPASPSLAPQARGSGFLTYPSFAMSGGWPPSPRSAAPSLYLPDGGSGFLPLVAMHEPGVGGAGRHFLFPHPDQLLAVAHGLLGLDAVPAVRHACLLHGAAGQGPIASSGSCPRKYNVELNATGEAGTSERS